ncbi:unnamed protein product [Caenorhabditis bovis]|uniref:Neurotransmitter-gated ion-channel ligand-binding domain-containing protein n=1 Tax=Caenorhabditis bovis TaxID=2654633 RepID=A0A8S1EIL9_9PELO|nr:unnamed protein product [Caenorhabditis bovis]
MADMASQAVAFLNIVSLLSPGIVTNNDLYIEDYHEKRILSKIFKGYEGSPPNVVTCIPYLSLKHIQAVDDVDQTMSLFATLYLSWKDDRLVWNPADYNGIEKIGRDKSIYNLYRLWIPEMFISDLSSASSNIFEYLNHAMIQIVNDGMVRISIDIRVRATCAFDFGEYPHDFQNCSFSLYTPYDANTFRFSEFGVADHFRYESNDEAIPDVNDYKLSDIESEGFYIFFGNLLVKKMKDYNPRYLKPIFRYNLIFERDSKFYKPKMAYPILSAALIVCISGLFRGLTGIVWLLLSSAYLIFNLIDILESLPPNYSSIPLIGQFAVFLLIETMLLNCWRIVTMYLVAKMDIPKLEKFEDSDVVSLDVVTIGESLISVILGVEIVMSILLFL